LLPIREDPTVIPLRRAYGTLPPWGVFTEGSEIAHSHVHCAVRESASDVCLYLCGEFDIYNKREVAAALASSMTYRTITIDLAQTRFIDAGIIGIFARFAELRRELDGEQLRIVNVNGFFLKVFLICRLDAFFCIEERPLRQP
jgi:anti-anti-sigma factor